VLVPGATLTCRSIGSRNGLAHRRTLGGIMTTHHLGHTRVRNRSRWITLSTLLVVPRCAMDVPMTEDGNSGVVAGSRNLRPARPADKEACDACAGIWGVHGIEPVASCICRTKDAGQSCTDGSDCQGACIVDDDAPFEIVAPGDPPRGTFVGRCADYDTTYGCYRVAPRRDEASSPLPENEAAQDVCVD